MFIEILDIQTPSISKVKRSSMKVLQKADKESVGVYVFNREKAAEVMLTQKQYKSLNKEIDSLYDQFAEKRIN